MNNSEINERNYLIFFCNKNRKYALFKENNSNYRISIENKLLDGENEEQIVKDIVVTHFNENNFELKKIGNFEKIISNIKKNKSTFLIKVDFSLVSQQFEKIEFVSYNRIIDIIEENNILIDKENLEILEEILVLDSYFAM